MTTTIDIAVCFDCSSSISFYSQSIRRIVLTVLRNAFLYDEDAIRMALIEFQSHTDDWLTRVHPFTSSLSTFEERINAVRTVGGNATECKAVADALNVSLTLDWRSNTDPNRYHEKLVILFTDGPPCNLLNSECPHNSIDLWRLASKFEKQNITLVVIGIEPSILVCEDFYCGLAKKTGGEYIPLINAARVLSSVIPRAILEEDTLSQLLHRLSITDDIEYNSLYKYSYVQKRISFMFEYCRTMKDIRKWLYTYRNQTIGGDIIIIINDNDYSEPESPVMLDGINKSSTPITIDEGYRTRLPTTASSNSTFTSIDDLSLSSDDMELYWNGEIDDDSI